MHRRPISFLLVILGTVLFSAIALAGTPPRLTAEAAVLFDTGTGKVLLAKNPDLPLEPASTTKIMTAVLAIEYGNLHQTVSVSRNATATDGTIMKLNPGEKLSLENLLYGLLLVSGNDAAIAIAEAVCGSEARFAQLMEEKARVLGMTHTQFRNANGLPEAGHYTTARDLTILTRYAMQNPIFARIVRTKTAVVPGIKPGQTVTIRNHNKLLWRYPYATGVKTGYTASAGGCLVASATRGRTSLIVVVLKSKSIYDDTLKLFNYGFSM